MVSHCVCCGLLLESLEEIQQTVCDNCYVDIYDEQILTELDKLNERVDFSKMN